MRLFSSYPSMLGWVVVLVFLEVTNAYYYGLYGIDLTTSYGSVIELSLIIQMLTPLR